MKIFYICGLQDDIIDFSLNYKDHFKTALNLTEITSINDIDNNMKMLVPHDMLYVIGLDTSIINTIKLYHNDFNIILMLVGAPYNKITDVERNQFINALDIIPDKGINFTFLTKNFEILDDDQQDKATKIMNNLTRKPKEVKQSKNKYLFPPFTND